MTEDEMVEWHHWLNGHGFDELPSVCGILPSFQFVLVQG